MVVLAKRATVLSLVTALGCAPILPHGNGAARLAELAVTPGCRLNRDAPGLTVRHDPLTFVARGTGFFTTPFKYLGSFGWADLGVDAIAEGVAYQDSAWSTDGFTTIDVHLRSLEIRGPGGATCRLSEPASDSGPFIRIEVKPWVRFPSCLIVREGDRVKVHGRLKVDTDLPGFYEIHPRSAGDIEVGR